MPKTLIEVDAIEAVVSKIRFEEFDYDFFPGTGSGWNETPGGYSVTNRKLKHPYYYFEVRANFKNGNATSWNFSEQRMQDILKESGVTSFTELVGKRCLVWDNNGSVQFVRIKK